MPRPKPDEERVKDEMLLAAEKLLTRHGPAKVTLSDIAAQCGMSQSNAYRYFPSKQALMATLATRWFRDVEERLAEIAEGAGRPETRLAELLRVQLALKLSRYDEDPALFLSYLALASENPEAVSHHASRLSQLVVGLVGEITARRAMSATETTEAAQAFLDATILIRDPWLISRSRDALSGARVDRLIKTALTGLGASPS